MPSNNQKKITSFFSCVPLKRQPDHNTGVSPDPKRSNSTAAAAATSAKEQNLEPCTKNLSQRLGSSGSSKLSLGRPRSVLKEKSQACSNDLDAVFAGEGTQTQAKKSSPAAVPKIISGKDAFSKGKKRKGSENVPGRVSITSLLKPRHGSESKQASGKPSHRKVVEVYLSDSSEDDTRDGKLNRAGKEEEEEEDDEFPDSPVDLRDKYDCGKLIIGKAEGEFTSDSETSPEKLQKVNKKKEGKGTFLSLDLEDSCTNEATETPTKGNEVKQALKSPQQGVSGVNKLGKTRKIDEEEDTMDKEDFGIKIEAKVLKSPQQGVSGINRLGKMRKIDEEEDTLDKGDSDTRIESVKVIKEKAEEERAFILSDLSEDLFDSPRKDKVRLRHKKLRNPLKRADTEGKTSGITKQDSESGSSSEAESVPEFLQCSQAFHLNGKDETDSTLRDANRPPKILKLQAEGIFFDESLGVYSQDESMELFPEVTAALREANSRRKTREAADNVLEDSPMMELTQTATSEVPSGTLGIR